MATKDANGALHDENGRFTGNGGGAKKATATKTKSQKRADAEKIYNTHADLNEQTSIHGEKKVTIPEKKPEKNEMEKILNYYGFKSVEEAGKHFGFYSYGSAKRFLEEKYEEDILWD